MILTQTVNKTQENGERGERSSHQEPWDSEKGHPVCITLGPPSSPGGWEKMKQPRAVAVLNPSRGDACARARRKWLVPLRWRGGLYRKMITDPEGCAERGSRHL